MAANALDFEEITRPQVFEPCGVERPHRIAPFSDCSHRERPSGRVVNPERGKCSASVCLSDNPTPIRAAPDARVGLMAQPWPAQCLRMPLSLQAGEGDARTDP